MSRFGFVGGSYQAQNLSIDAQICMNLMVEKVESGAGKSDLQLVGTPGLSKFATLTDSPMRSNGLWQVQIPNSIQRGFAVAGSNLFEVLADGTAIPLGPVANDGLPVSLASSNIQLMIASGGQGYCYTFATNTLSAPVATIAGVTVVGYIDGFFWAVIGGTASIFVSNALDGTTWDPAQKAIVSVFPDNIISAAYTQRQWCLFGEKQSVCYYDSGNLFPFDVVPGGFAEQGSAAAFGVTKADNTIFGIWADERGGGVAFRAQGYTMQRISTHAVEAAWQDYATISDAVSYSFQMQGHTIVHWYFPTANKSWRYDVATGLWHEVGFWANGAYTAHRSNSHMFAFGKHLVGDPLSGTIYQMAMPNADGAGGWLFCDDFGNPKRWLRRAPYVGTSHVWNFFSELEFLIQVGLGTIQSQAVPITLLLADSNGVVWAVGINDDGTLSTTQAVGTATTLTLNDPGNTTSWRVGVTIGGLLTTTSVVFSASNPTSFAFVTAGGTLNSQLLVTSGGQLQTDGTGPVTRDPVALLRWSDDGANTWKGDRTLSLGKIGKYLTRVIARRLGKCWGSIGRVFELSGSDNVPIRIVDADLIASPDMEQHEPRIAQQLRGRA